MSSHFRRKLAWISNMNPRAQKIPQLPHVSQVVGLRDTFLIAQVKKLQRGELQNPYIFSRERSKKSAYQLQDMLSRLGRKSVVTPEVDLGTRHPTGVYEVWAEKQHKKRRR